MSNLHRIQWIDTQIRANRFPNCSRIAEEYCISRRQASRDIEYLRDSMCAPIEYSSKRYGYYYTDTAFVLPGLMVTESEKQALTYLADQYRESKSSLASNLADLFSRLAGQQSNNVMTGYDVHRFPIHEKEIAQYNILKKAIHDLKKVEMVYINYGNNKTSRLFCPYKIFTKNNSNYIVGYCELRDEIRIFRLSRIREIRVTDADFQITPGFDDTLYGEDLRFDYRDQYQAVIAFESEIDTKEPGLYLLPSGDNTYTIPFTSSSHLISSLIRLDVNFNILHPAWLKTRLVDRMKKIIKKNLP